MSLTIQALHTVGTVASWVPDVAGQVSVKPKAPAGFGAKFTDIVAAFLWVVTGICVAGIAASGGKMALQLRGHGGGGEGLSDLGWALGGSAIVGSASGIAAWMM